MSASAGCGLAGGLFRTAYAQWCAWRCDLPLCERSTDVIRILRASTDRPIIASGGVMSAEGAREKLKAGAALVQIYTGLIYRGPQLIREIIRVWGAA